jgi:hypothetical protein
MRETCGSYVTPMPDKGQSWRQGPPILATMQAKKEELYINFLLFSPPSLIRFKSGAF